MSKYDGYWRAREPELGEAIERAARGEGGTLDVSDLRDLGERESWHGSATVRGAVVEGSSMAHMTALARLVASDGLCTRWPEATFSFALSGRLVLRVAADVDPSPTGPHRPQPQTPAVKDARPAARGDEDALDPVMACETIHSLLDRLPVAKDPAEVTFENGLYFFYEAGESSAHAQRGRVVRVGNHPRSQGRLQGRLRDHYRSRVGAKNGSVFRRYIGGALLRRQDPSSACLSPSPGMGHWESQNQAVCASCATVEALVTEQLESTFSFRCVRIDDMGERNALEERLIATLAACPVCVASEWWLGGLAYPQVVRSVGMWNSQFVGGQILTAREVEHLEALVERSSASPSPPPD